MLYSDLLALLDVILVAGLVPMGLGYLLRSKYRHLLAMSGHFIYTLHWFIWTILYLTLENNPTNAIFTLIGVGVFGYLGYHEYVNFKRDEYLRAMEWAAKGTAVTAVLYLLVDRISEVSGLIVYGTAWQTAKILNWMGYRPHGAPLELGTIEHSIDGPSVDLISAGVPIIGIILACTGIQAMILFLVFNIFLKADVKRKFYGFLITVPAIYVANQFRNVATIYLKLESSLSWNVIHNWLGKIFSFLVLIGIVIYSFKVLPEALDNLFTVMDLLRRDKGVAEGGKLIFPKKEEDDGGSS